MNDFRKIATVGREAYEDPVEAAEDRAAASAWAETRDDESLPGTLVRRLVLDRENPLVVWREHRGLTQEGLARRAACSPSYLLEIETGAKDGSIRLRRRLAGALGVDLDDLEWRPAD